MVGLSKEEGIAKAEGVILFDLTHGIEFLGRYWPLKLVSQMISPFRILLALGKLKTLVCAMRSSVFLNQIRRSK